MTFDYCNMRCSACPAITPIASADIHFGRAVMALRDPADPVLDDDYLTRVAWYHTSTHSDWPTIRAKSATTSDATHAMTNDSRTRTPTPGVLCGHLCPVCRAELLRLSSEAVMLALRADASGPAKARVRLIRDGRFITKALSSWSRTGLCP
ncbi:hypothetical protein BAY61_24560 [Prauserella marina]|nr:hypothetical protein BAY61_24560 [Prauserella marina]